MQGSKNGHSKTDSQNVNPNKNYTAKQSADVSDGKI